MERIKIAGACVVVAVVTGTALASASYASVPNSGFEALLTASFPARANTVPLLASTAGTPGYVSPLLAKELSVLTNQGISPARASEAINVQTEVARSDLVSELQAAMASTYAGAWFEPAAAQLHVGVTSPASRRVAEEVIARAGLTADVTITPVRSTSAQLEAAQKRWNDRRAALFARAEVKTAIVPQDNAVSVEVSSSLTPSKRAVIEREAATSNVNVVVSVVPSSHVRTTLDANTTKCKKFETNEAYCDKPITAGVKILTQNGAICTAGALTLPTAAANKSETYLLTAGHCIENAGGETKAWFATNRVPEIKKIGLAGKFINGPAGDVGVIKVENAPAGEWTTGANPPVYAVMAKWGLAGEPIESVAVSEERLPLVGRASCREGDWTGEACGQITAENVSIEPDKGKKIEGLVEWKPKAGEPVSQPGDSGGPFYSTAVIGVAEEGTLVGKTEAGEQVYEPLGTAFKELKAVKGLSLELLTTGNEKRPPCS